MAINVDIPAMGESISEAVLVRWIKADGDRVEADDPLCEMETDKASFDLPSPAAGVLHTMKQEGETIRVGETIARIDDSAAAPRAPEQKGAAAVPPAKATSEGKPAKPAEPQHQEPAGQPHQEPPPEVPETQERSAKTSTETARAQPPPIPDTEAPKDEAGRPVEAPPSASARPLVSAEKPAAPPASAMSADAVRRVPMSKIRRRIAERLVRAQQTAAMLTTFNEIDMTAVVDLRNRHAERFKETHGVSLGLMSFFARACVLSLKLFPALNAEIDGDDILYHEPVHLGIAVSTERGLVVPVIRNVEAMTFARIEAEIKRVAIAARDGKLSLQELSGGTFTITNGGVFGSLLSTPILNPPQTGILGMHTIQKRPMVVNDQIEARPMMYVALTYDHRLVDGKDSVSFLVRIKQLIEDPTRMILES